MMMTLLFVLSNPVDSQAVREDMKANQTDLNPETFSSTAKEFSAAAEDRQVDGIDTEGLWRQKVVPKSVLKSQVDDLACDDRSYIYEASQTSRDGTNSPIALQARQDAPW